MKPNFTVYTKYKNSGTFGKIILAEDNNNKGHLVAIKRVLKVKNKLSREYEILIKVTECNIALNYLIYFIQI